jgi:hypothetical protein
MKLFSRVFNKTAPTPPTSQERIAAPDDEAGSAPPGKASIAIPAEMERAAQLRMAQLIVEGSVDPVLVARLAIESPSSRVRQLAAEAIEDPAQLKLLLKQIGHKDKNVYKIIKQKCDALSAEERKAAQIASEVEGLCASLERHSHRHYDPLYAAAFEHLEARWRSLTPPPSTEMQQRAQGAIDGCGDVIAEHRRELAEHAARLAAQESAREMHERAQHAAQEAHLAQVIAEAQLRSEAALLREAEEAARAAKQAADEQFLRRLAGLIRNANGALSDGNTQRAAGLRRAIEEKLAGAPSPPLHLTRLLQQLDDKLNELKQWKDYAVAPKRIALIEEMQALIGSTEDPQTLADRIKALQLEWRTISQGIISDVGEDWDRFHQASQAAYQPCREYFRAQAAMRQGNLDRRKVLLERLAAFERTQTGEDADWPLTASVLREAPQEWRRYFPVDREAGRAVQAEFDAAMARLQARLDTWHERNAEYKQSLIKRAQHLLTLEDGREAIDAAKRLQSLWKDAAPGPRNQDQRLWSEFRELLDAVYKKREQAFAEYAAGLESNKERAAALCEEAERVAALSGAALIEAAAKIPDWRSAFEGLGEMPRADARGLQARFERALDLCEMRVAEQQQRNEEQSFTHLFEAGRQVQRYGWAIAQHADPAEQEALKQAAQDFIAGIRHWPKGGLQAIRETLDKSSSMPGADAALCEKALRTLCIRCEIHGETPTPPEDEALRREYQVQRLMRGMGQGIQTDEGDWAASALEWIRIGAVAPALYESLSERFMRCRANRPVNIPPRAAFSRKGGADDRNNDHDDRGGSKRRHGRDRTTRANAR